MKQRSDIPPSEQIVTVVQQMLETQGYDAVQLREVARRARVSLATVYKSFATRDELIVISIEQWMSANNFAPVALPAADETPYDGLVRILRHMLEPWEANPRMLEAYHRARSGPGGRRLDERGISEALPAISALFTGADPDYVNDIGLVLSNMIYALISRFAAGSIEAAAILPTLERTVFRMTNNNEPQAVRALHRSPPQRPDPVLNPSLAGPYGPGQQRPSPPDRPRRSTPDHPG